MDLLLLGMGYLGRAIVNLSSHRRIIGISRRNKGVALPNYKNINFDILGSNYRRLEEILAEFNGESEFYT